MMTPLPHQIEGAKFLAERSFGILADAPRVGKTGAAIMAADMLNLSSILVVTTASGRGVWKKAFDDWSLWGRPLQILTPRILLRPETRVAVVGWPSVADPHLRTQLLKQSWDLLILDEGHYAKSFEAKRTQAVYGVPIDDATTLARGSALGAKARIVWPLTGTPMPNSPFDLYPMLRFGAPERLVGNGARGWPDVSRESAFKKRYCKIKPKKIGNGSYARWIDVIVGGQNLAELKDRCADLMLLRTQQDVGIRPPIYETLPLVITEAQRRRIDAAAGDTREIMRAIDAGNTKDLEMHLGPLRRLTGSIKAELVVKAVREEFESGLDRIVLAYWHTDVGKILLDGLAEFGVVGIDGATPGKARDANVKAFQKGAARVFLAQIMAAAEAIDLSASAEMIVVEPSFIPKDMKQISLRITNHTQTRQARVRVAALDGSIDDAIQTSLLRKWSAINEVLPT
jgi:SWI/SNF-related matrix-associated actin-dependent regulator 1 of chromatin subfamily A